VETLLPPVCAPVSTEVRCTVSALLAGGERPDLTTSVTWSAADSTLSDGLVPSTVAVVSAQGVLMPQQRGNVAIHARHPRYGHSVAPYSYLVDPSSPAVALAPFLMGFVSEVDGTAPIQGVAIEILDGGSERGKSDVTRVNGYYFIQHIRMGVPLTVRASKAGYQSVVSTHAGIVDASGHPIENFLHFRLPRQPTP
jgi:hypothetical protein